MGRRLSLQYFKRQKSIEAESKTASEQSHVLVAITSLIQDRCDLSPSHHSPYTSTALHRFR